MRLAAVIGGALLAAAVPSAARAGEIFGGLYVHDVKLPTDLSGLESGADVHLGYRFGTIGRLWRGQLQPFFFGSLNTAGNTDYASVGLSAKYNLGRGWYFRPGLGIAIHNGSAGKFFRADEIAFGSRVLFEPELNLGTRINDRLSIEASWVHMSHAQLEGHENPGIDNLGVRLNLAL